jgi:hypothetical protein
LLYDSWLTGFVDFCSCILQILSSTLITAATQPLLLMKTWLPVGLLDINLKPLLAVPQMSWHRMHRSLTCFV